MTHAGIIRFMSIRNTSQERRLFCSLHPHSKLCKFFAISFDSAKAFDRKIHGSIPQFAAEGDCSHQNESINLSCAIAASPCAPATIFAEKILGGHCQRDVARQSGISGPRSTAPADGRGGASFCSPLRPEARLAPCLAQLWERM